MQIIDGTKIAATILEDLRHRIVTQKLNPHLHIVLATTDPAARKYSELKQKKAGEIGITCHIHDLTAASTAKEVFELIAQLSDGITYSEQLTHYGIMVQLPLYPHLQDHNLEIINAIPPQFDVDGLTAINQGRVSQNLANSILPATVNAILKALAIPADGDLHKWLEGKHVVVINHSNLIGKPLAAALLNYDATVTIAHQYTADLAQITRQADILVSATGQVGLITADMIKQDTVIIDVTSINTPSGIKGDVMVDEYLKQKVSYLTPVPGGIGPLTIACLFENLLNANNSDTD